MRIGGQSYNANPSQGIGTETNIRHEELDFITFVNKVAHELSGSVEEFGMKFSTCS